MAVVFGREVSRRFLAVRAATLGLALAAWGTPLVGFGADPLPGSADPGQIEKRFEPAPAPRALPKVIVPETAAALAPEEAARIRLELRSVTLDGTTVLTAEELRPLYADLLNREITLLDVYQLAGKITALYGTRGYLLSRAIVPPQTIANGAVRLTAVEGYVDRVVFEGKPADRPALFDYYAEKIRASRPLHAAVLERYALLANDLAGVKAMTVLRPSADNSGAATLVMDTRQRHYDGMFALDNRGTEAVGPEQALVELNLNSLLARHDRTTLRAATTPGDARELHYFFLGHAEVLNGEGTLLSLSASRSGSEPGTDLLRLLEVTSSSTAGAVSLSHPVIRSRSRNLSLSATVDYRTSETEILGSTDGEDRNYTARGGLLFDLADAWGGVNLLSLTLSGGLEGEIHSRSDVPVNYTLLALYASRTQTLTDKWSLLARLAAQAAGSPLPAGELFGLGGETFGRGYDPSEWVGDEGVAGSVDLIYRTQVPHIPVFQGYLFYDQGTLWRRNPVNEARVQNANSGGVGVLLGTLNGLSLAMEAAKPLGDRASPEDDNDWRFFARAMVRF